MKLKEAGQKGIELRGAGRKDIDEILYLYEDKFGTEDRGLRNELRKAVGTDRMVLAYLGGKPVGFLRSRLSENPDGSVDDEVLTMVIARDFYGRGVGGALLEAELEHAFSKKARILRMGGDDPVGQENAK